MDFKEEAIPENDKLKRRRPPRFELIAGAVCLDFINTLDDRFSPKPKELLTSYIDLARFGEDAGILPDFQVDRLFAKSMQMPEQAQRTLDYAIELRETMYQVFWALVQKKPLPRAAMIALNQWIQNAAQHAKLIPANGKFEWEFDWNTSDLDAPLWPIARSAAELLVSDQLPFVRACASKTCEWLFLDQSKNHRKRWCDMTKCGNRAKVRRFYTRKKRSAS